MSRFDQAGYAFARTDFKWTRVEKVKGTYDFSVYDGLTDTLTAHGVRPLYVLDYANPLYDDGLSPHTDEARTAFANFAAASAAHFRQRGIIWEIWNEPNINIFWKPVPNADDYALMAIQTAHAMHAADPGATVIAPGSSTFPWPYLETLFRHGLLREIDGVSVHPYRSGGPESAAADIARLRGLIALYTRPGDPQRPVVASEWGYSTYDKGIADDLQAAYMTREWLSDLAAGVNLSIYYDFRDDGNDPTDKEQRFGALHNDLTPKPAFTAAASLIGQLRGYRFVHRVPGTSPTDWRLLFQQDQDLALVTWSSDPSATVAAQTPAVRKVAASDPDFGMLHRAALVQYGSEAVAVTPLRPGSIRFTIHNPGAAPAQVRIQVGAESIAVRARPGASQDVEFWSPIAAPGASTGPLDLPVAVSLNGQPVESLAPVTLVPEYPIGLAVAPARDGVQVSVTNRLMSPFRGTLHFMSGGKMSLTPVSIEPGGTEDVPFPVDPGFAFQASITDEHGISVAPSNPTRFVPLPGFPTTLADAVPFNDVEFIHDIPDSKGPLALVSTGPGAPARVALALPYRDGARWLYTQAVPTLPSTIPAGATGLDLWIYANGTGQSVTCRYRDATGQTFQPHLTDLTWTGWKLVHIPFYGDDHYSWGGAADGIPHGALSWVGLINVDGKVDSGGRGEILIAGAVYEMEG